MLAIALLALLFAESPLGTPPRFDIRRIDAEVVATLQQAWKLADEGRSAREAGVMVLRDADGSYTAKLVFDPASFHSVRFEITADVVAILHTHPNQSGREPSPADRANADLLQIPTFTLTDRGLWVYNPKTRDVRQVMIRLTWLNPKNWSSEKLLEQAGLS